MNQRWLFGRDSYRPPAEVIRSAEYDVAPLEELAAKAFVTSHHYSGSYPAARFRYGLHRRGRLVGVAVFSVPMRWEVFKPLPFAGRESVELGRFVLVDEVPGNGETWFLARCFEQLRTKGLRGVVSFSDPIPRTTLDGRRVFPGHVGTIYQAHNGAYVGRGRADTLRLLPDGRVLSRRAISKIRNGEQGLHYASAILESHGAAPLGGQDPRAWLAHWLPRLTRPLRHPGTFKYAWTLHRRDRSALKCHHLAYPKLLATF